MKNSKVEICFIGNAIVDILSKISDEILHKLEVPKGSMQLVDEELSDKILKNIKNPTIISGGVQLTLLLVFNLLAVSVLLWVKLVTINLVTCFQRN